MRSRNDEWDQAGTTDRESPGQRLSGFPPAYKLTHRLASQVRGHFRPLTCGNTPTDVDRELPTETGLVPDSWDRFGTGNGASLPAMRRWVLLAAVVLAGCGGGSSKTAATTTTVASEASACQTYQGLTANLHTANDYGVLSTRLAELERTIPDSPLAPLLTALHDAAQGYAQTGQDSAAVDYSINSARAAIAKRCGLVAGASVDTSSTTASTTAGGIGSSPVTTSAPVAHAASVTPGAVAAAGTAATTITVTTTTRKPNVLSTTTTTVHHSTTTTPTTPPITGTTTITTTPLGAGGEP